MLRVLTQKEVMHSRTSYVAKRSSIRIFMSSLPFTWKEPLNPSSPSDINLQASYQKKSTRPNTARSFVVEAIAVWHITKCLIQLEMNIIAISTIVWIVWLEKTQSWARIERIIRVRSSSKRKNSKRFDRNVLSLQTLATSYCRT